MSFLLFGNLLMWLTPLWMLSVGVTIGVAILLVLYGLLWLVARPAAEAVVRGRPRERALAAHLHGGGVRRLLPAGRADDARPSCSSIRSSGCPRSARNKLSVEIPAAS